MKREEKQLLKGREVGHKEGRMKGREKEGWTKKREKEEIEKGVKEGKN